jgi:hypothetical protein
MCCRLYVEQHSIPPFGPTVVVHVALPNETHAPPIKTTSAIEYSLRDGIAVYIIHDADHSPTKTNLLASARYTYIAKGNSRKTYSPSFLFNIPTFPEGVNVTYTFNMPPALHTYRSPKINNIDVVIIHQESTDNALFTIEHDMCPDTPCTITLTIECEDIHNQRTTLKIKPATTHTFCTARIYKHLVEDDRKEYDMYTSSTWRDGTFIDSTDVLTIREPFILAGQLALCEDPALADHPETTVLTAIHKSILRRLGAPYP